MISGVRRIIAMALLAGVLGISVPRAVQARPSAAGLASVAITSSIGTAAHPQTADRDGSFTIRVAVQNFTFDQSHIGVKPNRSGVGHYHVYADSFNPSQPFKFWIMAAATTTVRVGLAALAKAGVAPGVHTLYLVLANNDHSLVEPLAIASTVVRIGPLLRVAELANLAQPVVIPANGKVTLHVNVNDFRLDPRAVGSKTDAPGAGHYHIYVNSFDPSRPQLNPVAYAAGPTMDVTAAALAKLGITVGVRAIYVVLANNDHSLAMPLTAVGGLIQVGS